MDGIFNGYGLFFVVVIALIVVYSLYKLREAASRWNAILWAEMFDHNHSDD